MIEKQFADFVFSSLDQKIPALRNEHNDAQVNEVQTLVEQLKNIISVSLDAPKQRKTRGKRSEGTND